ncbi:GIY-YIG nuclease family protein [Amycolatopsis thermophila]|uniref:Bacteriophage T5 Orf172 DNA-binding domain-containing protein n=1 Tax=Amycolatopsis thermophila TaxID=206084 RepID=A0ABU0ENJ0_9PSEU|nr:GIY-YIG nuclease family protein [Amycolatopsis thermophila]MDQ0376613.1 hypothetical protein [Amycolatopsis thermophila]
MKHLGRDPHMPGPISTATFHAYIGGQWIHDIALEHGGPTPRPIVRDESGAVEVKDHPRIHHEFARWRIELAAVVDALDAVVRGDASPDEVRNLIVEGARLAKAELEHQDHEETLAEPVEAPEPSRSRATEPTNLYVIGVPGESLVKIGIAKDVRARVKQLRNGSGKPLEVLWHATGSWRIEQQLHAEFSRYRTHGEWFEFRGRRDPVGLVKRAALRLGAVEVNR